MAEEEMLSKQNGYLVWKDLSIPCDACGTENAETMQQKIGQLCEDCYNAWNCPCEDCKAQVSPEALKQIANLVEDWKYASSPEGWV